MPSALLAADNALCAALLAAETTAPTPPEIPLAIPDTTFFPTALHPALNAPLMSLTAFLANPNNLLGRLEIACAIADTMFLATPRKAPTPAENADLSPCTPLLPSDLSVDGRLCNAPLMPVTTLLAAPFAAPIIFLMPFARPFVTLPPSDTQLNAVTTATIACIICGMLAIREGIACIMPDTRVTIIFNPVAINFGALSLIILAILVTICGIYVINVGRLLAMPCAMFKINCNPASINCPAFARSCAENCVNIGSTCAKKFGIPCAMPLAIVVSRLTPTDVSTLNPVEIVEARLFNS